jgi:hypothetical protein
MPFITMHCQAMPSRLITFSSALHSLAQPMEKNDRQNFAQQKPPHFFHEFNIKTHWLEFKISSTILSLFKSTVSFFLFLRICFSAAIATDFAISCKSMLLLFFLNQPWLEICQCKILIMKPLLLGIF